MLSTSEVLSQGLFVFSEFVIYLFVDLFPDSCPGHKSGPGRLVSRRDGVRIEMRGAGIENED